MSRDGAAASDSVVVNCVILAETTFLDCRYCGPASGELLGLLTEAFVQVRERGTLLVEFPPARLAAVKTFFGPLRTHDEVRTNSASIAELSPEKLRLLWLVEVAAGELQRLWSAKAKGAIRSLGYAVHPISELVLSKHAFEPRLFSFNFRIAAFHWSELSSEMQQALCDLAGIERTQADSLVAQENFAVKIYGKPED